MKREKRDLVVHCFYGCAHRVVGKDARENHAKMEEHYRERHPGEAKPKERPPRIVSRRVA